MTEEDRINKIRSLKFEAEKCFLRVSEIMAELEKHGCNACIRYEDQENGTGTITIDTQVLGPEHMAGVH